MAANVTCVLVPAAPKGCLPEPSNPTSEVRHILIVEPAGMGGAGNAFSPKQSDVADTGLGMQVAGDRQ